ncbi:MAG TPA: metal-dependent hydrolase [Vicinamibacterales bacterium]|nr:metal-dependent hydrolase [Vicinamibacterales bacterium]
MPSPVGHALGGFAFGWLAARSSRLDRPVLAGLIFAGLGAVPDVDILVEGTHRLYTHSIAAVGLVALLAAVALRSAGGRIAGAGSRRALVIAATAAYASHLLLDWLGDDRSVPIGIRALWPFTDAYFQSELRWFPPVERRYWLPGFWTANLRAIGWEMLVLMPLAAMAVWVRARQTGSAARVRTPRRAQRRE